MVEVKFLKIAVPFVIIALLLRSIVFDWQEIVPLLYRVSPILLIISFLFLLTIYPEAAFSWYVMLGKMGVKVGIRESFQVWILSTASRYVPGAIWQYIGRVELAKQMAEIPRNITVASLLFEIFIAIIAAVVVGFLGLYFLLVINASAE